MLARMMAGSMPSTQRVVAAAHPARQSRRFPLEATSFLRRWWSTGWFTWAQRIKTCTRFTCSKHLEGCLRGWVTARDRPIGVKKLASHPLQGDRKGQYISLKNLLMSLRSKRIKHLNKVKKLILRLERLRWRHMALLRFILVVDLLDLPAVDTQTTCRQHLLCHLVL